MSPPSNICTLTPFERAPFGIDYVDRTAPHPIASHYYFFVNFNSLQSGSQRAIGRTILRDPSYLFPFEQGDRCKILRGRDSI